MRTWLDLFIERSSSCDGMFDVYVSDEYMLQTFGFFFVCASFAYAKTMRIPSYGSMKMYNIRSLFWKECVQFYAEGKFIFLNFFQLVPLTYTKHEELSFLRWYVEFSRQDTHWNLSLQQIHSFGFDSFSLFGEHDHVNFAVIIALDPEFFPFATKLVTIVESK